MKSFRSQPRGHVRAHFPVAVSQLRTLGTYTAAALPRVAARIPSRSWNSFFDLCFYQQMVEESSLPGELGDYDRQFWYDEHQLLQEQLLPLIPLLPLPDMV